MNDRNNTDIKSSVRCKETSCNRGHAPTRAFNRGSPSPTANQIALRTPRSADRDTSDAAGSDNPD